MYPQLIALTYVLVDYGDGTNTMWGINGTVYYLFLATQNVCKRRKNQQCEEPAVLEAINKIALVKSSMECHLSLCWFIAKMQCLPVWLENMWSYLTTTWYSRGVLVIIFTSVL